MSDKNVVFITGVSSGIGYGLLTNLIESGYFVIGTVRTQEDLEKISNITGSKGKIVQFDVQDREKTKQVIKDVSPILDSHGLFALIHNVGIVFPGPLQYISDVEFDQAMDVNVHAVRRISQALLPWLGVNPQFKPGKIIHISSVSGLVNMPFNGTYCISKHALESMNDIFRRELASFGIKVTAIEPGPIKTPIWKKNLGKMDKYFQTEYKDVVQKADKIILNSEKIGLPVTAVVSVVNKVLESNNPKHRYLVHPKPFFFRLFLSIPSTIQDYLILKTLKKGDKFRPV